MEKETASGNGKVSYKDYAVAINKYLIPILGSHHVDNIDYQALQKLDDERRKRMGKEPTRSILLTHNAALNLVFDEAVYRGYMVESSRPKLQTKGKKSERRVEFSVDEVRAIRANFDAWIQRARADAKPIRQLLKDYVEVLLDTGARPGKELLELTWAQVELDKEVVNIKTGVRAELSEDEQHGEEITKNYIRKTLILNIEKGKTGKRKAVGRLPSVYALNDIAQRNYSKTLEQMIKSGSKELIFTYKDFVSNRQSKPNRIPKLISPTSFSKLFDEYLKQHNLLISPITNKKRVLYSLRHTYATLALTHDKVSIHTLAKQMGTSVAMIEQHYSHLDAVKAMAQLRGEESRQLLDLALDEEDKKRYAYVDKGRKTTKT
jgi:integrase